MHLPVEVDLVGEVLAVDLERAAEIVNLRSGDPADEGVGDERRDPPEDQPVLAILAPAGDQIESLVQLGDEARDVVRVVLPVGVHRDDQGAARRMEAGVERRRLTGVAPKEDRLQIGADLRLLPDQGRAAVVAAVVDGDDLELLSHPREHGRDLVEERDQVVALVVDGEDDADVHDGASAARFAPLYHAQRRLSGIGAPRGGSHIARTVAVARASSARGARP